MYGGAELCAGEGHGALLIGRKWRSKVGTGSPPIAAVSETDFITISLCSEDDGSGISICSSHMTPNGASIVTPIRPPKQQKSMMQ
eukprot:scaffold90175_cov70-Attheya_sp.AAC.1